MIAGCINIVGTGIPTGDYQSVRGKEANYQYRFKVNNSKDEVLLNQNIGMCGGGVFVFLGIPIPYPFNECENEGFRIRTGTNKQIYLRYNGVLHNPNRFEYYYGIKCRFINNEWIDDEGMICNKINIKGWPIFKIDNFTEFKEAKDKAILVEENGVIIKEIPFEWGWKVFFIM